MKVAIDTSPISANSSSAHKVRGVGSYINMLVSNLKKYDKKNSYVFVYDGNFPDDADLIHYPYFDPFFITLPRNLRKKFVVTVHDLTPLVFPEHFPSGIKGKLKWELQKMRLKKANLVVTDSNCSKKDVEKIVGISSQKVKTVYLAASENFVKLKSQGFVEIRRKYSLPDKFLLYVGDATWNKNLPRLVEAVKMTKVTLVMVGKVWSHELNNVSNNPWNRDLKDVLSKMAGDKQFNCLGFVSDEELVKLYNSAIGLVMPSLYEGFGLPVLEAMSCGCPVITSREGSLPEVGGEAVYYADAFSSESIKEAIVNISGDEKLRLEFSKRGMKQVKKFSTEKSIRDIVKVYESLS